MMKKSVYSVALGALLAAVSLPATLSHAADPVFAPAYADPAPQVVHDWSGGYLGGSFGWGKAGTYGFFDSSEDDPNDAIYGTNFNLNGAVGSVHAGFNHQLSSNFVVGVEGDWSFVNWSETLYDGNPESDGTDYASFEINSLASIRGRIGAAINNNASLIYATGGISWLDASYSACDCDDTSVDPITSGTIDIQQNGLVFGAGFEHKLSSAFSIRAEGLYYNWNNPIETSELTLDSDEGDFAEIRDAFVVRVGASYHF